jgi:hypothetical protein
MTRGRDRIDWLPEQCLYLGPAGGWHTIPADTDPATVPMTPICRAPAAYRLQRRQHRTGRVLYSCYACPVHIADAEYPVSMAHRTGAPDQADGHWDCRSYGCTIQIVRLAYSVDPRAAAHGRRLLIDQSTPVTAEQLALLPAAASRAAQPGRTRSHRPRTLRRQRRRGPSASRSPCSDTTHRRGTRDDRCMAPRPTTHLASQWPGADLADQEPQVTPGSRRGTQPGDSPRRPPPAERRGWKAVPPDKTQMSAYVQTDVLEQARDAVAAVAGRAGAPRNLSDLVTDALRNEVTRLAAEYNNGRRFPARDGDLPAGRPPVEG